MVNRKICVVTGTRAEYGLLKHVISGIQDSARLRLQLIVTGTHLSPEFGLTYREIEQDGFEIDAKVEMLLSADTSSAIAKSMGLGMIGFADALRAMAPDLMLVLGDRFEVFAAVAAAMVSCIPVAHLHGGEASEGVIDEAIRHCVTKMSHLHFVATEEYRNRVVQLGENPSLVYNVGGLGVDAIRNLKLLSRREVEEQLNLKFGKRNIIVTFHPVTLENQSAGAQVHQLLLALKELEDTTLIFTMPNADTDGRVLFDLIKQFVNQNDRAYAFTSLGQLRYLSCLQFVDGVVGNSSSGLLEAPSFRVGTVNIGDRQRGRVKAASVIDCNPVKEDILTAISQLYSSEFQSLLSSVSNPYGEGGASAEIVKTLETISLGGLIKKRFHDLALSK